MKLFALIICLLLLGASGAACWGLLYQVGMLPGSQSEGTIFGLWLLMVAHLVAASLLTACYLQWEAEAQSKK